MAAGNNIWAFTKFYFNITGFFGVDRETKTRGLYGGKQRE
jgi:hypothetical protein